MTSLFLLTVFAVPNPWTVHSECPVLARALHFADCECTGIQAKHANHSVVAVPLRLCKRPK